jgi:polysaccharide export outer membrane protein
MRPLPRLASFALALVLLVSCGGPDLPVLEYHPQVYRLGGGDEIRVITYGEDELTGDFHLNDQGDIALPLVGVVHGAGLTTQQLSAAVEQRLKEKNLITNPSISIEVLAYRPIFVLGEVAKPGQYPYQPGMTMLTAVAVAGGFTYRAVRSNATVVRTEGDTAKTGLVLPQSFIVPGDVINVRERYF